MEIIKEAIALHTSRGRLLVFVTLSIAIFLSKYQWLAHLSLWQAIGLHWVPSIGLTRAYWLLLHGDPVAAWHRNKLIYLVLLVGLPLIIRDALTVIQKLNQLPKVDS